MNTGIQPVDYAKSLVSIGQRDPAGVPAWMRALRAEGLKILPATPIPDRKVESWRYAGAQRLFRERFVPELAPEPVDDDADAAISGWMASDDAALRIAIIDGRLHLPQQVTARLPDGISLRPLAALSEDASLRPGELVPSDRDLFAALNAAGLGLGFLLEVAPGVALDRPIEVIHLWRGEAGPRLVQPRMLLVLGKGASATLIEQHLGSGDTACFSNAVSEIRVGEGAHLIHLQYQGHNPASQHLAVEALRLAAGSRYTGSRFSLGAGWARNEIDIAFAGEGAVVDLAGLMTVGAGQLNDIQTHIRHAVPGCRSDTRFKAILHGAGRGVVDGQIEVAQDAQRSEAHLNTANLMLARDAEIDARPTLEILADDVQCSHGASVGQLDPLQLYYLRSRGIDTATATRLLAMGFAREILQRNPYGDLAERLERRLAAALADVPPGGVPANG